MLKQQAAESSQRMLPLPIVYSNKVRTAAALVEHVKAAAELDGCDKALTLS